MGKSSTYEILTKFGESVVDALGKSLPHEKDATGALRNSINFKIKILGNRYEFRLYLKDYYEFVDAGRKTGKGIPVDELRKWLNNPNVISKLNRTPKLNKKGKPVYLRAGNTKQLNRLTFPINKKIKQKGIKPTHFYTKVVNKSLMDDIKRQLRESTKKDIIVQIK